jgi:hypothetical protein
MLYCYYSTVLLYSTVTVKKKSNEKMPAGWWCKLEKVLVVHLPLLTLYFGRGLGVTGGKCDLVVVTYGPRRYFRSYVCFSASDGATVPHMIALRGWGNGNINIGARITNRPVTVATRTTRNKNTVN